MGSTVVDTADAQAGSARPSPQSIVKAFQGDIEPVRTTATYRLGILAVFVVMVLLPLVYVALIGAVGYLVYWHTVNNVGILQHGRGKGKLMVVLVYLAPLIVGSIMTLFMMKPLFARSSKRSRRRSLSRDEEPLLFAFVDRVCQAVHAPRPRRIDIDCEINASASFRRGVWSMLRGNDLVLTLGMPLVVGLSVRQFAGILAHEFGHFAQGAGMRLTYVIRSISFWFTRVVYERDAWDEWLERTASGLDLRLSWVLHLARLFVWLSRRFLWVLMVIGHGVSGYMLRQMEFDADRHECRLAGSDAFPSTMQRVIELSVGNNGAQHDLQSFYRDGRLGDDLPRLIEINVEQFPDAVRLHIDKMIAESRTGVFDTHPSHKDRNESARRENAPGIFHAAGPASMLFHDAQASSRAVTTDFYEEIFGDEFRRDAVHPLDGLLARQSLETESMRAMARYFQGTYNVLRPLPIPSAPIAPPGDPELAIERLRADREQVLAAAPAFRSAFREFDEADTYLLQVHCANSVFSAKERPRANQFSFAVRDAAAVANASHSASSRAQTAEPDLATFESAMSHRFAAALGLLLVPEVAEKVEGAAELQAESQRLLAVLQQIQLLVPAVTTTIRNSCSALSVLFGYVKQQDNSQTLVGQIRSEAEQVHLQLVQLKQHLQPLDYPFDHAQGPLSAGDFVIRTVPSADDFGSLHSAADGALQQLNWLTGRLLGRLAQIAECVEAALGLPPLPAPADEQPAAEAAAAAT